MPYKIVNKKTGRKVIECVYDTKKEAQKEIAKKIRNAPTVASIRFYRQLAVRKS